jgi:hypothetical protein
MGLPPLPAHVRRRSNSLPSRRKNTLLSATNPMTYTHLNKQKQRGLHLAPDRKAKPRSSKSSINPKVMPSSFFKRSVLRA